MFPLINKTHYSIQKAFTKPEELAKVCKEMGYTSCGLIDGCTLGGAMDFATACKSEGIKPIYGCDFSDKEKKLIVVARNLAGWKRLLRLVTKNFEFGSPDEDSVFLDKNDLLGDSLIVISSDPSFLLSDHSFLYSDVAIKPSYYAKKEGISSYQILRALDLKVHLPKLRQSPPELFNEDLSIPDLNSWAVFSQAQLDNLHRIDELCESYKITQDPKLPHFKCPDGMTEIQYLTQLCRDGWVRLINGKVDKREHDRYAARVKQELKVIELANLSGYFLIVWDFVKEARDKGILVGPGRGSCGGCLVSYLLRITLIDPLPYDLLFSRFYNASRSYPKHVNFTEYKFVDDWRDI
jgi:DNA polymerase-3 subunit alpha